MRTLCKKALALCVVFALALTCFVGTLSVSAADPYDATLTVADVDVNFGDTTATAVLHIAVAAPGINEAIINIDSTIGTIDAEPALDLETLVVDGGGDAYVDVVGDDFSKLFLSAREAAGTTELNGILSADITVVFTLNEGVKPGTYPINIVTEGVKAADKNETVVNLVYATVGNFVVTCDHANATEEVTKEATCTETGVKTITCACGYTTTEEIPVIPHDYEAVVTEPTCEAAGFTTYTCSVCGDSYTGDETEALGHSYTYESNGDGTHKAICANESIDASFDEDCADEDANGACDKCEYVFPVEEPECEHVWEFVTATPAEGTSAAAGVANQTTTSAGSITLKCAECDESVVKDVQYYGRTKCFTANAVYESAIKLEFSARRDRLVEAGQYTNAFVRFEHVLPSGTVLETSQKVDDGENTVKNGRDSKTWAYAVKAMQLTETINTVVFFELDGVWYSGEEFGYSVRSYADTILEAGVSDTEATLVVNMLRYGSRMQTYKNYNTENLADTDLPAEYAAMIIETDPTIEGTYSLDTSIGNDCLQILSSYTLFMESRTEARFRVRSDRYTAEKYKDDFVIEAAWTSAQKSIARSAKYYNAAYAAEGELTYTQDSQSANQGRWEFYFGECPAYDFRQVVTFKLYDAEDQIDVGNKFTASIEQLIASGITNGTYVGAELNMYKAMMNYSDAAKAHFCK